MAHQAIIVRLKELARNVSGESVVVTLWPHPRIVLNKGNSSINLITTLDEKIALLDEAGIENLVILPFDKKMAAYLRRTKRQDVAALAEKYIKSPS